MSLFIYKLTAIHKKMNRLLLVLACIFLLSCQSKKNQSAPNTSMIQDTLTNTQQEQDTKIDTLLNSESYLILGHKPTKIKVVKDTEADQFPTFKVLNQYRSDVILGEDVTDDWIQIYRKYHPKTTFKEYPATVYNGPLADPDFSTNPDAKVFIPRIKDACANGINFAGHYTLVLWGCGTACQSGVVVDRITGRIFDGYISSVGSEFKKDSNMIIKNIGAIDPDTNLIEVCASCGEVSHNIWTGTTFKTVE